MKRNCVINIARLMPPPSSYNPSSSVCKGCSQPSAFSAQWADSCLLNAESTYATQKICKNSSRYDKKLTVSNAGSRCASWLFVAIAMFLGSGCAHHVIIPPGPNNLSRPQSAPGPIFEPGAFLFYGRTSSDTQQDLKALKSSFWEYVRAAAPGSFANSVSQASTNQDNTGEPIILDVTIRSKHTAYKTYIVDLYSLMVLNLVAPWWGKAELEIIVEARAKDGRQLTYYRRLGEKKFFNIVWSWFRTDYIDDAFLQLYSNLFAAIAGDIAADRPRLALLNKPKSKEIVASKGETFDQDEAEGESGSEAKSEGVGEGQSEVQSEGQAEVELGATATATATERASKDQTSKEGDIGERSKIEASTSNNDSNAVMISQTKEASLYKISRKSDAVGFRLILESRPQDSSSFLYNFLRALGGVEVAGFRGFAQVTSSDTDTFGNSVEVASGKASQKGYRIALYTPPKRSNFFWYPIVGYVAQDITMSGFADSLSQYGSRSANFIEPVCSDPDLGTSVDCGAPSRAALQIRSGYGGLRGGFQLLAGTNSFQIFASGSAGLNLIEYRKLRAQVGRDDATGTDWDFLRSGAVGGSTGFLLPKIHLGLRLGFDYEFYRSIKFAHKLTFRGPAEFNPDKNIVERPPAWVDAASFKSWSFQASAMATF